MRPIAFTFAAALAVVTSACATMNAFTDRLTNRDPFAFMEEVEGKQALDWVRAQNARSLAHLEADARFAPMREDALKIVQSRDRLALGSIRDGYLYNFWQDGTNVRGLWRRSPLAAYAAGAPQWETLLDVDALSTAENANWVFKGTDCQPARGTRCLVTLSNGGKDASVRREFDLATKTFVADGFNLPEAKAATAWKDADTIYLATDWGAGSLTTSGYPFIVKELKRGQALADAKEVFRGAASDVGVFLQDAEAEDGARFVAAIQGVTFFTSNVFRLDTGTPAKLNTPMKSTVQGLHKGELILTLEEAWTPPGAATALGTGSLISITLDSATTATPVVKLLYGPGPRDSIESVAITRDAVLVAGYSNVRGRILRYAFDGRSWLESQIPLPPNGAVGFAGASSSESTAFATFEDFLRPDTLFAIDARAGSARAVQSLPAQFDASKLVSEQFEATSRDGTKVPYFVVRPRDAQMNGENPTLLYGYGGFQISQTPAYSPLSGKLWMERGGVYVIANIRGGGEFGPAWHQAGLKLKRQVVYDDFIAVAEDLIARKITSPRRLGIMGGSNGGLLMGVMLTQRPDLFRAAVVQVPLLDMLGFADANMLAGASWVDEYGDPRLGENGKPTHPDERAWLAKLSPYQNMRPQAVTPVMPFFVTSTKDDRVHPAHARKMAARLEAAGTPFYYYENIDGGHSAAANQQEVARRRALEFTYLNERLVD
ncbi:MAG: S9 family peptidase [Hyphomonadaceae bacterium]|nr:MAG: prolyl oligopeptidase [Caulobacteraceae bacterium]MBT9447699.1 S9 family peptidase [Hyphomonadaceae bacterium]TPW02644.1 MAG: prolyl oligopeptidase [Alphaproteobacteria bacterium]